MYKHNVHTLILMLLFFNIHVASANDKNAAVITVQGTATVQVSYQKVTIQASVTTSDFSAENAVVTNNSKIQSVVNMLNGFGISADDITTSQFSFYPKYRWQDNRSIFDGYAVTHAIQVGTKNIDRVGEVLDLMIEGGIGQINSVQFGSENTPDLQQQVLKEAVAHAKVQAQALAEAAGVNLGGVVHMRVSTPSQPLYRGPMAASAETDAVPIMPGEGQVQTTVIVDYAIQ
ncbi:SIMPL domain-containing protein [Marinicella sp. W31]|uniref:SIMPL domain-containing protein n=1 Tax=Marinicella sp. W31 TaxID=3023713 RepID=UPI0037583E9B